MARQRSRWLLATLLISTLTLPRAALAQAAAEVAEPTMAEAIHQLLLDAYPDATGPGAALLVMDDGEVVYRGARGMADVELGVPLDPGQVFRLGSITKQFTAAAILLLEEEGKLSLDDPIDEHLPDYPTHGHTITIEHLLTHTSGIASYTGIPGYMDQPVRRDLTTDELVEVFRSLPMDFAPGERWAYSNSGYVLLGAIIEAVSGMSYAVFVEQRIFAPLGMESSHYGGHQIVPGRVNGYLADGEGYINAPYLSMTQPHAAGSLLSTVDDLARWDAALASGELISPDAYRRMTTPFTLNDGEATRYGYGLMLSTLRGHPTVMHGGGIHGFVTFAGRLPADGVYVAALSNYPGGGMGPGPLALKAAALAAGDPFPDFQPAAVPAAVLEGYVGVYRIDEGSTRTVTVEDGRLYTQRSGGARLEAIPHSETGFFYRQSLTHFEIVLGEQGQVSHMLMYHDGGDQPERADFTGEEIVAEAEVIVDPSVYDRYVGRYELMPGFVLTITRQGDRLMSQATGQAKVEIFPSSETEFFLKVVDARLTFEVGATGPATAVVLNQGGVTLRGQRLDD